MSSLQAFFFYRQKNLHKFNLWNLLNNLLIQIPFSSHHIHRFNFPINLLNTSKFRAIDTDFKRSRMDRLVIKNIETQFPSWDILYISLDDSTRWFNGSMKMMVKSRGRRHTTWSDDFDKTLVADPRSIVTSIYRACCARQSAWNAPRIVE